MSSLPKLVYLLWQTAQAGVLQLFAMRTAPTVCRSFFHPHTPSDIILALVLSPLNDLHSVFSSSTSDGLLSLQSRVSLPLPAIPHIVVFTQDDARLLVAFASGPLSVYDSQAIFQSSAAAPPLHTFPFSGRKPVRDIFPSPGDMQTVALVREAGDGLPVEIIDVQKLVSIGGWNAGGSPATNPTSGTLC